MFCPKCGSQNADSVKFCESCGADMTEADVKAPVADTTSTAKKAEGKKFPLVSLIRNSAICLFAIIFFIFSFLPFISIDVQGGVDGTMKLSPLQTIILLTDTFYEYDDYDNAEFMKESSIYEDIEEIEKDAYKAMAKDPEKRSSDEEDALSEYMYLYTRFQLRQKSSYTPVSLIVAAIASLVYMGVCAALVIVSAFSILSVFGILVKKQSKAIYRYTAGLFAAVPAALLVAYYATYQASAAIGRFLGMTVVGTSLGGCAITVIVLSILGIIGLAVLRYIFTSDRVTGAITPRIIAIVLSVIVLCLAFAPLMSTTAEWKYTENFKEKEAEMTFSIAPNYFSYLTLSKSERNSIEYDIVDAYEKSKDAVDEDGGILYTDNYFGRYTEKEAEEEGAVTNNEYLSIMILKTLPKYSDVVITAMSLIYTVVVAGAMVILWQNLYYFARGTYSEKTVKKAKKVSGLVAMIAGLIVVTFIVGLSFFAVLPKTYSFGIGWGILLMIAFAFGSMFCPHKLSKDVEQTNDQYAYTGNWNA
jgi:hypothetical protein